MLCWFYEIFSKAVCYFLSLSIINALTAFVITLGTFPDFSSSCKIILQSSEASNSNGFYTSFDISRGFFQLSCQFAVLPLLWLQLLMHVGVMTTNAWQQLKEFTSGFIGIHLYLLFYLKLLSWFSMLSLTYLSFRR